MLIKKSIRNEMNCKNNNNREIESEKFQISSIIILFLRKNEKSQSNNSYI